MVHIWKPGRGLDFRKPDLSHCRAAVSDGGRWPSWHQCRRKAHVEREHKGEVYGFCAQHDPVAVEARRVARQKRWDEQWKARNDEDKAMADHAAALNACKDAIEQIAAGHNDPRALAVETLKLFARS